MPHEAHLLACAESLSVLADETRLRILFALNAGPASRKRIAFLVGVEPTSITYHLRILLRAGLIADAGGDRAGEYTLCGRAVTLEDGGPGFEIELPRCRVTLYR